MSVGLDGIPRRTRRARLGARRPAARTWVENGLVWSTRTGPWLFVRIPELHYDGLTDDERVAHMTKLTACLHSIGEGEAHLLVTEQPRNAVAGARTNGPERPAWALYAAQQERFVLDRQYVRRVAFLGIRLNRFRTGPFAALAQSVLRVLRADASTSSSPADRVRYVEQADLLLARLASSGLAVAPADADELAMLVARPAWLAIDRGADTIAGVVEPKHWHKVKVSHPSGDLWVTTLSCTGTAFRPFPDGAWLLPRAGTEGGPDIEPDISIRFDVVPAREQARLFGQIHQVTADQIRNITGGSERDDDPGVSIDLADQLDRTRDLEHMTRVERVPWVHPTISVTVWGRTEAELQRRVETTIGSFETDGITLTQFGPDQWPLLWEQIPGEPWMVRGGLVRKWPALTLAAGMPHASIALGMAKGPYFGHSTYLRSGPVHLDPIGLAEDNLATGIVLTGEPGSGKSATAKKMIAETALRGAWVTIFDPQNEYGPLAEYLAGSGVKTQRVTFGRNTPGCIDPWVVHRGEPGAAAVLAVELAKIMLPNIEGTMVETYMAGLSKVVSDGPAPSMRRFVDAMRSHTHEDTAAAGQALNAYAEHPLARLFFDPGQAVPIDLADAVTILQWQGLELSEDGENRTVGNRLSAAVLHATASLVSFLLDSDNRHVPKLLVFDEAHQFTSSPLGRGQTSRGTKGGRKVDLSVMLITQNTEHLGDASVLNNVRLALCFRSGDRGEQAGVCRVLRRTRTIDGTEVPDVEIMDRLGGLLTGECLMRDPLGRVGSVSVDHTDPNLWRAALTTPRGAVPIAS